MMKNCGGAANGPTSQASSTVVSASMEITGLSISSGQWVGSCFNTGIKFSCLWPRQTAILSTIPLVRCWVRIRLVNLFRPTKWLARPLQDTGSVHAPWLPLKILQAIDYKIEKSFGNAPTLVSLCKGSADTDSITTPPHKLEGPRLIRMELSHWQGRFYFLLLQRKRCEQTKKYR